LPANGSANGAGPSTVTHALLAAPHWSAVAATDAGCVAYAIDSR
jgi:hypothetical protein